MAEWFTTEGKIDSDAFESWDDVIQFVEQQQIAWQRFSEDGFERGAWVVITKMQEAFGNALGRMRNYRANGQPWGHGLAYLQKTLDQPGATAMTSAVFDDPHYKDIQKSASDSAAIFNAGFRRGVVTLADAKGRSDMLGALWEVAPGLTRTAELADLLSKERENTRRTLRSELDRLKTADAARLNDWAVKLQEARVAYVGWARRRSTRWARHTRSWEERHIESERRIRSVEESYREQMGLKAPVEYWQNKASEHKKAECWARLWVLMFFPTALVGMAIAFNQTGLSLIQDAKAASQPGSPPFPTAIFVVASAGLASCAGLVFWAGRLLTKLYLSQHHLRQDAEERATMTKTYLALIENSAASTEDRQVILNALFRNTPDGIVKEEGGLDPSIAAALGKFLAKP